MRQKLAVAGFSYLCAMVFASVFLVSQAVCFIAAAVLLAVFIISVKLKKQTPSIASIFAAIGILLFSAAYFPLIAQRSLADGNIYSADALIIDKRSLGNDISSYILKADIDGTPVSFLMFADDADVKSGDRVSCDVKFSEVENSTAFSSGGYCLSQGIVLNASLRSEPVYQKNDEFSLTRVIFEYRDYISERISLLQPSDGGSLMKAIFLGDKSGLSAVDKYNIKAAGAAHLTAVSGMHLSLIVHIFAALLMLLGLGKAPTVRTILTTAVIAVFMIFFGASASVLRAGLMLLIHYCGQLFFRKSACLNSIGAALVIILTVDPLACLDAGLIFSALTTVGAGAVAPLLSKRICSAVKAGPVIAAASDCLCCSVCASLFALPLSAIYFEMIPIYGIAVSVAVIPFFTVSLIFLLLFAITGGVFDFLLIPAQVCCEVMERVFSLAAGLPFSHFNCGGVAEKFAFAAGAAAVLAVYLFTQKPRTAAVASVCGAAAVIVITSCIIKTTTYNGVRIRPYSDGENGCILIESREYSGAVVYGGGETISQLLFAAMQSDNIRKLDFIHIANDGSNSEQAYIEDYIDITDNFIFSDMSEHLEYDNALFIFVPNFFSAVINGKTVSFSSAAMQNDADIKFCYGSTKPAEDLSGRCFCFDKRQMPQYTDDINLYYEETYIEISRDGGTVIKGGGDVNDCR